jgi:hypothetical protein
MSTNLSLVFGRDGTVPIACDPLDDQVSRRALALDTPRRGWHVTPTNRNGVMLHLWGQSPRPLTRPEPVIWPRVALRVLGSTAVEHWVLLDDDEIYTAGFVQQTVTTATATAPPVVPLTGPQLAAIRAVFGDLLAWPPKHRPATPKLSAVARKEDIGASAVQKRLLQARERATRLGFTRMPRWSIQSISTYSYVPALYRQSQKTSTRRCAIPNRAPQSTQDCCAAPWATPGPRGSMES